MGISDKQKFISSLDEERRVLFAHIYDLALRHERSSAAVYGSFLSESQQSDLFIRKEMLPCAYTLFGGFDDAERKMIGFVSEWDEPDFPISVLEITGRNLEKLTHRDFLGSIMALGIKREKCGDIITGEKASVLLHSDIAPFVEQSLFKIGNEGVSVRLSSIKELSVPEKKVRVVKGTVASLRLDAVVAMMTNTGRSSACERINAGRVFVNGICVSKTDMHLSGGEIISVRGFGRATLEKGGTSRKDRIFITLNVSS